MVSWFLNHMFSWLRLTFGWVIFGYYIYFLVFENLASKFGLDAENFLLRVRREGMEP